MKQVVGKITDKLLPIVIMINPIVNLILIYIGLNGTESNLRRTISFLIYLAIIILLLARLYFIFKEKKVSVGAWIILLIIPMTWILAFGIAAIKFGVVFNVYYWFIWFIFYCIPSFFGATILVFDSRQHEYLKNFKYYQFIAFPGFLHYIIRHGLSAKQDPNLLDYYAINYQGMSYTAFILTALLIISYVYTENKSKVNYLFILSAVAVNTAVVLLSGTKGAILCLLAFYLLSVSRIIIKKIKNIPLHGLIFTSITVFLICMFVWTPPSSGSSRIKEQIDYLMKGTLIEAETNTVSEEDSEKLINYAEQEVSESSGLEYENTNGIESDPSIIEEEEIANIRIYSRTLIYKLSLIEIRNNPLTGLGPLGFLNKYGVYTHNFVLEILVDFGLVGGGIITILFISLIVYLSKFNSTFYTWLMLFYFSYLPRGLVSGTIYNSDIIMFVVTISIALLIMRNKKIEQSW